jgi:hypothetical protein
MKITLAMQLTTVEVWRREVNADASVTEIFRRAREIVLEAGNETMDAYDILCALSELSSLGNRTPHNWLGQRPEKLIRWSRTTEVAIKARNAGIVADKGLDSVSDTLQAIRAFNAGISEPYRYYSTYELAVGAFASNSRLIKEFCKATGVSMGKHLERIGLSKEECYIVLEGRKLSKQQVRTRLRSR